MRQESPPPRARTVEPHAPTGPGEPDAGVVLTLRAGCTVHTEGSGARVSFESHPAAVQLHSLPPCLVDALARLGDGLAVEELEQRLLDTDGVEGLARWYAVLALCEGAGAVCYDVVHDGRIVASFAPAAPGRVALPPVPTGALRLSRFAHLRREGDALLLESPLARGALTVRHSQVAAIVAALSSPVSPAALAERTGMESPPWAAPLLSLLVAAGLVLRVDEDGATAEERSLAARHWDFADLVMHARSRTSRVDLAVGGTYRLEGEALPPPPLKAAMSVERIVLATPDPEALALADEPLARVMERRRSVRRHGDLPIDVRQLGDFLHRVARVRDQPPGELHRSPRHDVRRRPYPGGGACHPLEIYPVIARCAGLEPGLYHYDPALHLLEHLPDPMQGASALLRRTSVPMEDGMVPQVLLVLTARFRRLSWKYEGNAYALLLQEVGVLYQSMYLVATAMGLAPCAVGGGDAARFASIIGTDPLEEASVGAFTLGSLG